jgi:imidazolonepropionase-like amidohydrolase
VQERLGSLEVGKDANLIFFDGDPLEPSTRLRAVMLEGNFVRDDEVKN